MALRPKLNRVWTSANSVLRRDPGDAKYIQGWVSEIPTFQVLNYLQYKVDTTLLAQAERGIFEWGSDITYVLGSVVWCEDDKKIYVSTVGSPDKTKAPNTNLAHWSPSSIQVPRANYDAILASINSHIANKSNPHNLSAAQLGSYTKAETDALVAQYQALVLAHSSNKNNPHGVTALQVGAVPATGGTYTGDVTFNGGMYFDAGKVNQISKTGGLYLQAGTAVLGIDAAGVPVVGTTTSKSQIVTEAVFPGLKAAQEPSYAVPEPTIQMDLQGNINMRRGLGTIDSFGLEPAYSADLGNALSLYGTRGTSNGLDQAVGPYNLTKFTMAVDVVFRSIGASELSGLAISLFGPSNNWGGLISRKDGKAYLLRNTNGTLESTPVPVSAFDTGKWYRIVIVSDGPAMKMFVNGVLLYSKLDATATGSLVVNRLKVEVTANDPKTDYDIRNLRVWDVGLTDKQVSTL